MFDESVFDGCFRVLDRNGSPVDEARVPDLSDEQFLALYRDMRLSRHFDTRAVSLQRQGRLGTYAPLAGQEGAQVGSTHALWDDDLLVYQYREHGAVAVRGLPPGYLLYWMGHEVGHETLADRHVFPLNIAIASHLPHATGLAWAAKYRGDERAVVCHFGDGATSEGDFHEALNFAGVFDVPCVFVCNNNQWAISHPRERQTASDTVAEKARAYGIRGVRVDGMDPLACYSVTRAVAGAARGATDTSTVPGEVVAGDGPTHPSLVEMVSYRYGAHTTADDPTAYRDPGAVDAWRAYDPIDRLGAFLRETGRLDDEREADVQTQIERTVAEVIEAAESYEPTPTDLFDDAYADLPADVREQRAAFGRLREERGDGAFLREE